MTTLIVEDEQFVAQMILQYVEPLSSRILIAETLEDGLRLACDKPSPDIVTLDLRLPDCPNPIETLKCVPAIRKANPNGLLIVISGACDRATELAAIQSGVDAFFRKPEDIATEESFVENIRNVVRSIIGQPVRYQQTLALAEKLALKLAKSLPAIVQSSVTGDRLGGKASA